MFESEERKIARRIKDFIKREKPSEDVYIMLRNGYILNIDDYSDMVRRGRINPQDAYVYIRIDWYPSRLHFRYPFLVRYGDLMDAYLSKLGFHYMVKSGFYYENYVVPATGLKYVAVVTRYGDYLTIEVSNLDIVVNNTNLRNIVFEVLGEKLVNGEQELTDDEYRKIRDTFRSQQFFAGHDVDEARDIIKDYYDEGNKSLAKEVARIIMDYYRIFNSYRACYDMNNWKEVDCWSTKL